MKDISCAEGFRLVIKAEDGSPACVRPDAAQKLIERGWARQEPYHWTQVQPKITLNDYNYAGISQDSDTVVSINNQTYYQTTLGYSAYKLPAAIPTEFHNVTFSFPAGTFLTPGGAIIMLDIKFPDGYEETYGNHTASGGSGIPVPAQYGPHLAVNSTTILSNHLGPQAGMTIYHDRIRLLVSADNSAHAGSAGQASPGKLEFDLANQTYEAGYPVDLRLNFTAAPPHCELPSFVVRNMQDQSVVFGPHPAWNYTSSTCSDYLPSSFYAGLENNSLVDNSSQYLLEAEIYGTKYDREISVVPSANSGKNITAEPGSTLPGLVPEFTCAAFPGSRSADTVLNSSGFDGVYHRYYIQISHSEQVDDYFLKPGHNGTIVLKVHRGSAFPKDTNLAEGLGFFNSQSSHGNFDHRGVTATSSPDPAIAGPDGSATLDITLSATQDAAHGTYWVYLPPGACGGGMPVFLTIGDRPLAQPPDLLGYDLSVDFSFSESPVLTVGVSNLSIHTFGNCSLTYTGGNKTDVLDRFDAIPPGFSYEYHFSTNPANGDSVAFYCSNPHISRTYSPG